MPVCYYDPDEIDTIYLTLNGANLPYKKRGDIILQCQRGLNPIRNGTCVSQSENLMLCLCVNLTLGSQYALRLQNIRPGFNATRSDVGSCNTSKNSFLIKLFLKKPFILTYTHPNSTIWSKISPILTHMDLNGSQSHPKLPKPTHIGLNLTQSHPDLTET